MDSVDRDLMEAQFSAYLDGELSPERVAEVEQQLASDPDAQAIFDSLRRTVQLIRTLPRHPAPAGVLDDLTVAAERDQLLEPSGGRASTRPTRWVDIRSILGTAAVVVITVGGGLWFAARSGDMGDPAAQGTNLVATKPDDPVESHGTPPAPMNVVKDERPESITQRRMTERSAGMSTAEGAGRVQGALLQESAGRPSPIAPLPKMVSALAGKAPRLEVASEPLVDSQTLSDSVPASVGQSPGEHVLPLSFVCTGEADRQACELGLRRYIQARAPRDVSPIDSAAGPGAAGDTDMEHPDAPEPRPADVRSSQQIETATTDEYRVRVPASELLDLIDRVSSTVASPVVPELGLGPFRAVGRGRIEQLVGDSDYAIVGRSSGGFDMQEEAVGPPAENVEHALSVQFDRDLQAEPKQVEQTPERDPWITLVIRFLDRDESSESTSEGDEQDADAAQPPAPVALKDNVGSSP